MEIRFIPTDYSEELSCDGISGVPQKFLDTLQNEFKEYGSVEVSEVNYGPGADWMWLYAVFTGVTTFLALGSQINDGFEGWKSVALKLKKLIGNSNQIALDKQALTTLAVGELLVMYPELSDVKKVIEYDIEIPIFAGIQSNDEVSDFLSKAEFYYVQGYEVDSKTLVLFGSTSNGKLEVLRIVNQPANNHAN